VAAAGAAGVSVACAAVVASATARLKASRDRFIKGSSKDK